MIKIFLKKNYTIKTQKTKRERFLLSEKKTLHSELNINKTLKSQFNLLRICSNDFYPAFFKHKNNKYIIKIFKDEN